ncbi:hypothetical protein ElyMa_005905900 [Elysia marginata]|uniref:Uncharacterized protein n=1 Tax=Elysia marginata TaxID=1093978 RepID=A0AAV4G4P7_9GAST|nr:hypothetical protein ElyMa_005905900 [Elysia marginata]
MSPWYGGTGSLSAHNQQDDDIASEKCESPKTPDRFWTGDPYLLPHGLFPWTSKVSRLETESGVFRTGYALCETSFS